MSVCPNCGTKQTQSNTSTIIAWCVGIAAMFFVGIPVFIVVALATIASIGANANDDFSTVADQLDQHPAVVVEQHPAN